MAILEAGRWAPSAGNFQPWHFVVAEDEESRARIKRVADESKNLSRIWAPYFREGARRGYIIDFGDVPLCIAVFADPRHAPPHVDGNLHHIVGAALALQNMWLAADALGLGACCWSNMQQDKMKAIFGVPHYYYFLAVLGIGYVEGDGSPKGYLIDEATGDASRWLTPPAGAGTGRSEASSRRLISESDYEGASVYERHPQLGARPSSDPRAPEFAAVPPGADL